MEELEACIEEKDEKCSKDVHLTSVVEDQLEIPKSEVKIWEDEKLGEGYCGFKTVCAASWPKDREEHEWVCKTLHAVKENEVAMFNNEFQAYRKVQLRRMDRSRKMNFPIFLGKIKGYPSLIIEKCDTNLDLHLYRSIVDLKTRIKWCCEVARSVQALHGLGLCHGDLRCANILLKNGVALVDDFYGRVKATEMDKSFSFYPGFLTWLAPECLENENFTFAEVKMIDAYSLGLCISQILLGECIFKILNRTFSFIVGSLTEPDFSSQSVGLAFDQVVLATLTDVALRSIWMRLKKLAKSCVSPISRRMSVEGSVKVLEAISSHCELVL